MLLPLLLLGLAGCRHKNKTPAYQPPPPPAATTRSTGAARPAQSGAGNQGTASRGAPSASASAKAAPQPTPYGKPVSTQIGLASWYVPTYANAKAADGSIYDPNAMTAAHRELPMGSIVRVTNLANDQSVFVRITDHGPFVGYDRIIDLSLAAAKAIGVYRAGVAKVRVEAYAPPVHPGVDPAGKWCVQIGAFPDEADAIKLKNSLMRRYSTAKVIQFAGSTGHWVRIDPLKDDRATASQIANSIHVPGALPYIVRLN
ncbi:MAG: septal ring lytic transglycosylase RlpA family protein [Acidobacteriaceae bacterium]